MLRACGIGVNGVDYEEGRRGGKACVTAVSMNISENKEWLEERRAGGEIKQNTEKDEEDDKEQRWGGEGRRMPKE